MRSSTRWGAVLLGIGLASGVVAGARDAAARPPKDGFLDPRPAGSSLLLMPFFGPGFRAAFEHRVDIEKDMSDARFSLAGTVALPFSEVSASVDARFFLLTVGATAGYHHEWHLLRFDPDPATGRDRAVQPPSAQPPARSLPPGVDPLPPDRDPAPLFTDLDRTARNTKDQNADFDTASFPFYEGRAGFLWPGYGFLGSSTFTVRHEARPDVSFDWEQATVYSHGWNFRWEGYFLLRGRNAGFIGPALRAAYLPRDRVDGPATIGPFAVVVPDGSACQHDEGVPCRRRYEMEFQYGLLAGLRPGFGHGADTLLVRVYAAWGLDERLYGIHTFQQPLNVLVAYMAQVDL